MLFQSVPDLSAGSDAARRARYGMIEVRQGRLSRIVLRPWPKLVSIVGLRLLGRWGLDRQPGDGVRLYYSQPRATPNYLAVTYIVSGRGATWADVCRSLAVLDSVARLKRSDAIVCDVTNPRISARLLRRQGWEPLSSNRWHRYYIRRFYGQYPAEMPSAPEVRKATGGVDPAFPPRQPSGIAFVI